MVGLMVVATAVIVLVIKSANRKERDSSDPVARKDIKSSVLEIVKVKNELEQSKILTDTSKETQKKSDSPETLVVEELYERTEKEWQDQMRGLIVVELGHDEETFKKYLEMRDEFQVTRAELYREFHEKLTQERALGEDDSTQDDFQGDEIVKLKIDQKISEDFLRDLSGLLGDRGVARYIEHRENFNEELKHELDADFPMLIIEF